MKIRLIITSILISMFLSGCSGRHVGVHHNGPASVTERIMELFKGDLKFFGKKSASPGEIEMTEEEMYKLLEESGYGEGIDWSKQTDDDPSIPKSKDITVDRESIKKAFYKMYGDEGEPGAYEKAWWDYIPDSYDLTGDVFPSTMDFAGREKEYNNSLEQGIIKENNGYTTGQSHDLSTVQTVAKSFIYRDMKNRYKWTDDLDALCDIAGSLGVADFDAKECPRPSWNSLGEYWIDPSFMTAYFDTSIVDYDLIGIPQFGGYKFSITVWEQCDKPVGWVNELEGGAFMDDTEVYENMGEWDFYDNLEVADKPAKVVKPKLPNGVYINRGDKSNLSKEQYVYTKIPGAGGMIYYYGNGITVDMTFFNGKQGGNFEDALEYCRIICHNK